MREKEFATQVAADVAYAVSDGANAFIIDPNRYKKINFAVLENELKEYSLTMKRGTGLPGYAANHYYVTK